MAADVSQCADLCRMKSYKLVVFVPDTALAALSSALFAAGAGAQGLYRECAWRVEGTGQFRPLAGAQPALGEGGALEQVRESRLELLVAESDLGAVLRALHAHHPYEEPAYDIFARIDPGPWRQGIQD